MVHLKKIPLTQEYFLLSFVVISPVILANFATHLPLKGVVALYLNNSESFTKMNIRSLVENGPVLLGRNVVGR